MDTPNYITPEGVERLRSEYVELKEKERPTVVTAVAYAAALGDRSENADYIYGKKRLREIDRRLRYLKKRIEAAEVVTPSLVQSDRVLFGATVTLEEQNGHERTYQIVGEDEIDVPNGRISWKSPIAKAILGKKIDDLVTIKRPVDDLEVEIVAIIYK